MSRSRTKLVETKSLTERNLEAAVFGDESFYDRFAEDESAENEAEERNERIDISKGHHAEHAALEDLEDEQLFIVDTGTVPETSLAAVSGDEAMQDIADAKLDERSSVWYDSDDERLSISLASVPRLRKLRRNEEEDIVSGVEYANRLRSHFERVYPVPDWALPAQSKRTRRRHRRQDEEDLENLSDSDSSADQTAIALSADPLQALFRSSQSYAKSVKALIRHPGKLEIKRLRDANHQQISQSAIQTMSFHPTFPLMMTGGYDRTLRIYHIDGKVNTPASSLHLRTVPIENAEFHPDGKRVFIGGKRKYFHIWDLETGNVEKISRLYGHEGMQNTMEKFSLSRSGEYVALAGSGGWVNILSADTGQWIDAFKITRGVSDLVWHSNGNLTVANIGSEFWEYDPVIKKIAHRWTDHGGIGTTKIAIGGQNDRWFAVGDKSGMVNIYDRVQDRSAKPVPLRVIKQITTSIHDLKFADDGQILAITSRAKKDILRMVHLPSCSIYQNWPTQNTPLGKVGAVAFSPRSKMFSVGNEAGRVTLWSI